VGMVRGGGRQVGGGRFGRVGGGSDDWVGQGSHGPEKCERESIQSVREA